ncbi:MAG: class 1 fructose-bisphosphatase [Patescibacteria group bacterium]
MLLHEFLKQQGADEKLIKLFAECITAVSVRIRQAIERGDTHKVGSENASGEQQIALDVQANDILKEVFKNSGLVSEMSSEEEDSLCSGTVGAPFSVAFDPLDGSSLVDVNFSVGTILAIYPSGNFIGRTGRQMVAAAYVMYGPRTTLVFSIGKGTHECTLGMDGQFVLTQANMKIGDKAKHFAPGNLRAAIERADYLELVNWWMKNQYTLRYSGGFVPDINHILKKGEGIFTYPPYSDYPSGKLRILYEVAPMAYLVTNAGGEASDGTTPILEKKITDLHQRTPIFIGSPSEVSRAKKALAV